MQRNLFLFLLLAFTLNSHATILQHYPKNNEIITNENFYFICECKEEYSIITLEISNSHDFDEIIFSNSTRWLTKYDVWKQMPMSTSELGNGTFYWRVNYNSEYTNIMSFTISGQSEPNDNYKVIHDKNEYPPIIINEYEAPLVLSSLWIRSENTNNGLCQFEKGGQYHGMAIKDDIIYISFYDYINNTPHLNRYNAKTGESIDSVLIDYGDFEKPNHALSDFNIDEAGNLYAINAGYIGLSNEPDINLTLDVLDISNNNITVIKRYTCILPNNITLNQHIRFAKALGDVNTGEFTLYSTLTYNEDNALAICRWEFSPSINICNAHKTIYTFSAPATAEDSRIFPLDNSKFYYIVDNNTILPTLYKARTLKGDFTSETSFNATTDYSGNGMHIFKHGNTPMIIYGCNFKKEGSKFELITLPSHFLDGSSDQVDTFNGIKSLWKIPTNSLGFNTKTTISTLATTTSSTSANGYPQTNIYIYSNGNGLAAYQLSHYTTTSVDKDMVCNNLTWSFLNNKIKLSHKCDKITFYNINGSKISEFINTNSIDTNSFSKGFYVVKADNIVFKILI